jgi:hypothetical protein
MHMITVAVLSEEECSFLPLGHEVTRGMRESVPSLYAVSVIILALLGPTSGPRNHSRYLKTRFKKLIIDI